MITQTCSFTITDLLYFIREFCLSGATNSKLSNPVVLKFYLEEIVLLRFHLLFNNGRFFLYLDFESIEEKIKIGDLHNKLNYSYMLICSLSHELYTPINHLINSAEALSRMCLKQRDIGADLKEEVQVITKTSEGLSIFVQNMLDFARYINSNLRVDPGSFKLKEALEYVMSLFESKAKKKKLELMLSCPDITVSTDRAKLIGQLFIFLDNSLKYTMQGGVSVKIREGRTQEFIRFEIADSGIGISEEDLRKLTQILENPFLDVRTHGAAGIGIGFRVA